MERKNNLFWFEYLGNIQLKKFIILGIGNPLCILVLIRKRKTNPTILYLCLLTAFDILVLYTGLLRQVILKYLLKNARIPKTFWLFSGRCVKIEDLFNRMLKVYISIWLKYIIWSWDIDDMLKIYTYGYFFTKFKTE